MFPNLDGVYIDGYYEKDTLPVHLRKDRDASRKVGGVAIIHRNDWECKVLNFQNNFECIWCDIKTINTKYHVASLYHPPNPMYHETNHLEQILSLESNARIIVARNVNQLKIKDIPCQHNMEQMARKRTRGQKVFDIFLTNCPR